MYAIFENGSRQYKVSEGEVVKLDYRGGDDGEGLDKGTKVELTRVLLYCDGADVQVGQPTVEGARVVAEVVDHPSTKVYVGKYRRRKNYRRLRGHRQFYTAVRVKHILLPGQSEPQAAPAQPEQPAAPPAAPAPAAPAPAAPPA
jgi:large subunit ribosomal protein L21